MYFSENRKKGLTSPPEFDIITLALSERARRANLENDTEKREKTERGSAKIRLKGWGARKRSEDNGDVIDSQIRRVKRRRIELR